ncbi:DUF4132 domain-containing protein [Duncaniella freteri]|uniref:DUF4132 domain-containing protein n=5 Tax=Duncaniella TaxID=2518495 RepID=UPI00136F51BA|nr:DUF4132 domain-containing protein [Duncaniella freteri]NBJ07454.1 DUF4132 domain-containing protein [Alistipes sp. Z76]NCE69501.1 DUF4132 domain-containing protein [Muribaculaceae bacterium M3]
MKISWYEIVNDLCGAYVDKLVEGLDKAKGLTCEAREIINCYLLELNYEYHGDANFEAMVEKYAEEHGISNVAELFDGKLKPVAEYLIGREWSDLLQRYMRIESESPYTIGYVRRSIRCPRTEVHVRRNLKSVIDSFVMLRATGFSTAHILRCGRTYEESQELSDKLNIFPWLASMIDAGDRECIDYVKDAMTSENNSNRLTFAHFRAIAKSGNMELLETEGRLLLAARLQEGLRQAIIETMDEGRTESFIYMLRVIRDNNLQRFAAVKRGLAVSTGLGEIEAPERITDKFVERVFRYVTEPEEATKAVMSNDPMEVYLGLWAIAFYNVENIVEPVKSLIASAPAYRVEAAMLMLQCIQFPSMSRELVSSALHARWCDHGIIAGAMPLYLNDQEFHIGWYGNPKENPVPPLEKFFQSVEDAKRDFDIFVGLIESMKSSKETFDPYVFPWMCVELSRGEVATKICKIALLIDTPEYIERALAYIDTMDAYDRARFMKYMLINPTTRTQIEFVVNAMSDRGSEARIVACDIVATLSKEGRLTADDYLAMESHLRLKASGMRIAIIGILGVLPDNEAVASVRRLLSDKSAERRLAGLDIIKNWCDKGERKLLVESLLPVVESISRPSSKERILIDSIIASSGSNEESYNEGNGFGLYNPDEELCLELDNVTGDSTVGKVLVFEDKDRAETLMRKIISIIEENADYEFTDTYGETKRLGNSVRIKPYGRNLQALAKPDMWREFYEHEIGNPVDMLRLQLSTINTNSCDELFFPALKRILGSAFHLDAMKDICENPFYGLACEVRQCLYDEFGHSESTWRIAADVMSEIALHVSADELVHKYKRGNSYWEYEKHYAIYDIWPVRPLYEQLEYIWNQCPDDLFVKSFKSRYEIYRKIGYKKAFNPLKPMEYVKLWGLGLMSDNDFWREMIGREDSPNMVDGLTCHLPLAPKRYAAEKEKPLLLPEECTLVNTAVDRILEIELKRGDTPTVVSELAKEINVITGIDYLIKILVGLGKDKPTNNLYSIGDSKRSMFSRLLRVCCPTEEDTPLQLKKKAEEAGISDERLVEAAMFSPRWLEMVEQAIGWKGLTSAAYYFLAHTGENLDNNVKSHISRYTSVAPEDFSDGAFDTVWFHEIYRQLGKKRFEIVYDAAKYIAEGNRHTRARKLSDAVLGILKAKDVMKEITDKRNKDLVVAYGLIPLGRNRIKDLRQRYAFLNKFLKESKQFGAQRQASESRAVKLALDNLARTAGFGDSTRLTWSMEADLVKEAAEYLSPQVVDGVTAYISIGEDMPEIMLESKGKRLQSIPSRLKKDKYIERMREVHKQLKEQHVRGRSLLEKAMVESSWFTGEEISQLSENPVIWKLFSRLVLVKDGGVFGFPGDDGHSLVSAHGEVVEILGGDMVRIAHPHDFFMAGVWSEYQSALFDRQWRQPFKQVFRELYVPTEEEKEKSVSMRYSGNQIMPARAVGILKKRQWTVDYENGLQKVCFHGDVTAVMYALADWFSPSDIEAPTLEYVAFYDRRSFKDKKIADVLPVVFSEIMRDVDLAVSIAHAGGVDPEASHSTIEMRRVIVEHAMPMFGISNVKVAGNFAKVSGKLGNYNVHLGSGVIHKEGGAHIAVLPVHSQSRGRIFLPFLDEDPKTAEIISKILLFAEDDKIKDPSILSQI